MNRLQVELQAPWALSYYDAGVESGKRGPIQTMLGLDSWLDINEHVPEVGQHVIYYFDGVGVHTGQYKGVDDLHPDFGDCGHVFTGDLGWITGDVTHWLPLPDKPTNQQTNKPKDKHE